MAFYTCPHRGENVDTDPGGGNSEQYIEDCTVCRPNRLHSVFVGSSSPRSYPRRSRRREGQASRFDLSMRHPLKGSRISGIRSALSMRRTCMLRRRGGRERGLRVTRDPKLADRLPGRNLDRRLDTAVLLLASLRDDDLERTLSFAILAAELF
jgi:hypothetical protein